MKMMQRALLTGIAVLSISTTVMAQAPAGGAPAGPPPPRPVLSVTSTAWPDGGEVPMRYSGRGDNKSPAFEFHWTLGPNSIPAPESLQTYAVIFHDIENSTNKTAVDTLHWTAFNIPGKPRACQKVWARAICPMEPGTAPASRRDAESRLFRTWRWPRPIHHYVFEFYALDTKLDLPASTTREDLLKAMDGHVIGKAAWFGRFHMAAQ